MPQWFWLLAEAIVLGTAMFIAGVLVGRRTDVQRAIDRKLDLELHPWAKQSPEEIAASATCLLDESNDMEAFAALPECEHCEGTGKEVPDDFWGPADTTEAERADG